ncbi:uncharacterized protein EI90DRAFT_1488876 [Cantharellus anzutake]|uniref:uncharacterized protein n=1 Tax=Cantharellus anzutake TaxID=1750568 RepID=UPI0019035F2F|nr:uncharacterized protein EI90DRAFT_1488876 [Cantharellus anzutake]KAF8328903.1 hypothetical protein EI90DRAFT_1488876 [Cantharellus anzutake]
MEMHGFKRDLPVFRADPDIQLMRLFNLILVKAREVGFDQQYHHDIHYAKRPQRERRSKSGLSFSPRCLGVSVQITVNGKLKFGFSNALVIVNANPNLLLLLRVHGRPPIIGRRISLRPFVLRSLDMITLPEEPNTNIASHHPICRLSPVDMESDGSPTPFPTNCRLPSPILFRSTSTRFVHYQ